MVYLPEGPETSELHEAYEELAEAIRKVIRLNGWNKSAIEGDENAPMMMSEYLVLVAQQGFDKDGDGISNFLHIAPHGQLPWHRMIGLLRVAQLSIEHEYLREEDD